MAKRYKKNNSLSIILVLLVILLLLLSYLFLDNSNKDLINKGDDAPEVQPTLKPHQTEKPDVNKEGVNVDLIDYDVYELEEVNFNFIIASIRIQSDKAGINLDLKNFVTSDNIFLNDVNYYVKELEKNNMYLAKENVWFDLVSNDSEYFVNIFIPYDNKKQERLEVLVDIDDNEPLVFKLNDKITTNENLYYEAEDIISDGKTYQMTLSKAFEITGDQITRTYEDGYKEDFLYPSTAEVYAFNVKAVSLFGESVEIESAIYTVNETNDEFEAFNSQFVSMKYDNIIGKTVKQEDEGVLLFMTLNPEGDPITYKGQLKIKLVGKEEYITINVDL